MILFVGYALLEIIKAPQALSTLENHGAFDKNLLRFI